jgi:hypothetical protein
MRKAVSFFVPAVILSLLLCTNAYPEAKYQKVSKLPQTFQVTDDTYKVEFTITPTAKAGEYLVEGVFNYTLLGYDRVFDRGSAPYTSPSRLILYLAKEKSVLDSVNIYFNETDLRKPIEFKKTFQSGPFNRVAFGYNFTVR